MSTIFLVALTDNSETLSFTTALRNDESEQVIIARLRDEAHAMRLQIENLEYALQTARMIGAVVGILMTRLRVTYDTAFDVLSAHSQATNTKLRVVADTVVLTGSF